MVRPCFDDSELAHIEDQDYSSLRPEFTEAMEGMIKRVLMRPKLKTVNGKHLTGSMLLGLAIEYIEAMNAQEIPAIVSTFERVAHAEAQKYADDLFDNTVRELRDRLSEDLLPLESGDLKQVLTDLEEKAHKKICQRLYDTANISVITEILRNFMTKL